MNSIRFTCLLTLVFLLPAASAGCADTRPGTSASASVPEPTRTTQGHAKLPANVDIYATTVIGDGQQCLVGAKSDKDGLNERPVVYLSKPVGVFAWHVQLPILEGSYQGRATHCVESDNDLYVLVQIDTYSQKSLNQGLLQVVELNKKNGIVRVSKYIDVPNVSVDYTSWVELGDNNFKLEGSKLVIRGLYELMSERDHPTGKGPTPFTVEVPASLRP
jgi:hypothetical protein